MNCITCDRRVFYEEQCEELQKFFIFRFFFPFIVSSHGFCGYGKQKAIQRVRVVCTDLYLLETTMRLKLQGLAPVDERLQQ